MAEVVAYEVQTLNTESSLRAEVVNAFTMEDTCKSCSNCNAKVSAMGSNGFNLQKL